MRPVPACLALLGLLTLMVAAPAETPILIAAPDDFPTLVNPNCSHCKDEAKRRKGELKDDERVLCWIRGKYDGGAIPFRFFLNRYPVISDTYGVFVHDAAAGFARGFTASLDFKFHGYRNGVLVMKHKDGTLYSALSGRAFAGPKKGSRLEVVPTIQSNWGWWLKRYPNTVAYHLYPKYRPLDAPAKPTAASLKSRVKADPRLPAEERVLGVVRGKHIRAYRISDLKKAGLLRDKLGDKPIAVLYHEKTATASAYSTSAALELDAKNPDAPFKDSKSGSRFDITGRCVSGKLKGRTLDWLDSVEVRWFAWAAEYPETTVHTP